MKTKPYKANKYKALHMRGHLKPHREEANREVRGKMRRVLKEYHRNGGEGCKDYNDFITGGLHWA